jgi:hypothetical protein
MKRCPKCNRQYRDDTLRFCLDDGTSLTSVTREAEPPPTEILPNSTATQRSPVPTIPSYPNVPRLSDSQARQTSPLLTGGVIAIALLLLLLVGIVAYFVIKQSLANPANQTAANPTPTPVAGPGERVPGEKVASPENRDESLPSPSAGSLKITPTSSSVRLAVQSNTYYPANAMDGKRSTAWMEGVDGAGIGEWIRFDFDREITIRRILIQPGYFKSPQIWAQNNRVATLTAQFSNGSTRQLSFDDRMDGQKADLGSVRTRWVKLTIASVYYGPDPDTAISEVAFEWEP